MLSARVFPGSPNWAMNIVFPHLKMPVLPFILAILIGLLPWNFIVCRAGVSLSKLTSKNQVF
jgi:uncharacterized membrane protein YdjX (TVP38/TMEM64 family)